MRKSRVLYITIMLIEAVTLFWSGSGLLLGLLIAQIVVLILLWACLISDTRDISLALRMPSSCRTGSELSLVLEIEKKLYLAAGMMEAVLECENHMMNEKKELPVKIVFSGKNHLVRIPFQADACGQIHIQLKDIRCFDLFGVMECDIAPLKSQTMTVYPREALLNITVDNSISGRWEGEQKTIERPGRDMSEVFDLREYVPGDDVRRMHWKLSGKTGKMIMRQAGDTFRSDTYVLLDVGCEYKTEKYSPHQLSAAVSAAVTISRGLSKLNISHYTGIVSRKQLLSEAVEGQNEFQKMINLWMSVRISDKKGNGLSYFMIERLQEHFNRLIYITNGTCPGEFFELPSDLKITAVCIISDKDESSVRQQGNCTILEIPEGELWNAEHAVEI